MTNVEADHLDNYGRPERVQASFAAFGERIEPGGLLVLCADDPEALRLGVAASARGLTVRTYGESSTADYRAQRRSRRVGWGSEFRDG